MLAFSWIAIRLGIGSMPAGAGWSQIYGVALLTGIGFTMSLFIGTLAFDDPALAAPVRIGVLGGSLLCGALGYLVLRLSSARRPVALSDPSEPDARPLGR